MYGHGFVHFGIYGGRNALVGKQVQQGPIFAILPAFHKGEIKRAEFIADFFEVLAIAAVSAKPDVCCFRLESPASPKRLEPVF